MSINDLGYVPVVEPQPGQQPVAYLPAVDHDTAQQAVADLVATGEHATVCALVPDADFAAARQADAWAHRLYEEVRAGLPDDARPPSHHHGAETGTYPALDLADRIAELRALAEAPRYTRDDLAVFQEFLAGVPEQALFGGDAA